MSNSTIETIQSSIGLMEQRLLRASKLAAEAHAAIRGGEQNIAIGTLLPLQEDIADIDALLKTVFLLHRSRAEPGER